MDSPARGGDQPAFEDCPNCGSTLHGPYCSDCGQRNNHERLDTKELAIQVADELIGFDTALWRTVKGLTLAPGQLIVDYVDGRRRNHVGPFRYAVLSVLVVMTMVSLSPAGLTASQGAGVPSELAPGLNDVVQSVLDEVVTLTLSYGRALQLLLLPLNALAFGIAFGVLAWMANWKIMRPWMKRARSRNSAELFCYATYVYAHTNILYGLPLVVASFAYPHGGLVVSALGLTGAALVIVYGAWAAMPFFEVGFGQGIVGNLAGSMLVILMQLAIVALIILGVAVGLG